MWKYQKNRKQLPPNGGCATWFFLLLNKLNFPNYILFLTDTFDCMVFMFYNSRNISVLFQRLG